MWQPATTDGTLVRSFRFNILERDAYPPGYMYFKVDDRWKNKDTYVPKRDPAIVHANWVTGKETKRNILKKANLWTPTGKLLPCRAGDNEK